MAGIGFELKKILRHETFISELAAYLYAATVSTGPWLISVITLAVLGTLVVVAVQLKSLHSQLFDDRRALVQSAVDALNGKAACLFLADEEGWRYILEEFVDHIDNTLGCKLVVNTE